MFSRFTNALYNAVDALAPPHPLQEDFIWHWKAVTRFYTGRNASNKTPIEVTSIPGHLLEMLSILEQEEKEIEDGNVGPCMEYIMQHKLLDTMCILASSDAPPGMKQYMFMFITRMLKIIQLSLMPHVSIYVPTRSFIELCGEVVAGPTESEEMEFLQCICDKISDNPHLVNCFISDGRSESRKNSTASGEPNDDKEANSDNKSYSLVTSLLKLYKSPDNDISLKARECLKNLCSCANDTAAMAIAQFTFLSQILCSSIASLYKNIPKTIKTRDLENPGEDGGNSHKISPEKRKYLCYLQQLLFLDSISQASHPVIGDHLSKCFKTDFLHSCLYTCLVESDNEDELIYVTTLIASSLRNISSHKLINSFGEFLLDDQMESTDYSEHKTPTIQDILIERCRNSDKSVTLSLCNLQLFEELLLRPTQFILNNLILKYLEGRGYYDVTAADSWLQFSDDDVCSRYSDDLSPSSSPTSKEPIPTFINRIIESFLALLPDDIKSCETEEESGYETYIKEAHGRFMKCLIFCEDFDWPQDLSNKDSQDPVDDDSSSESQPEADSANWAFYEGPFLSMIFDKLEQMLVQPYEINLQVTSIISRLVLFAHPLLHEYLLNPLIPYTPDARSLFLVLFKVSEEIQKEVPNIKGFKTKIKLTRNALLSDGNEYATFEESNILEVLIVLEEFCKELSAIAFVKYHAIS